MGRHAGTDSNQNRGNKTMKRLVIAAAFAALGITAVVAQSDPIAARKAVMKENGAQAKIAGDMVKGTEPFDLAKAHKVLTTFAGTVGKNCGGCHNTYRKKQS